MCIYISNYPIFAPYFFMIGHRCRSDAFNVVSSVVPDTLVVFVAKSCIRFLPHNFATCASKSSCALGL